MIGAKDLLYSLHFILKHQNNFRKRPTGSPRGPGGPGTVLSSPGKPYNEHSDYKQNQVNKVSFGVCSLSLSNML